MKWTAGLVVVGAALRFGFAVAADELREDERYRYAMIADHLRRGEGFAIEGNPTAQAMPLWPAALAALPAGMKPQLVSALLSSAALAAFAAVARRLAEPRVALIALGLLAVDLDQATLAGTILTEPLFTLLLMLFALAWTGGRTLGAAAAIGLAALVRPEAFLVPLAVALFTREWKRPLLLLAGVALCVAPWAIRNASVFGAFVPFTTTGGITLDSGMNETEAALPFRKRGQARGKRYRHALVMARERTEVVDDRELGRQAIQYALAHPVDALGITASKAAQLWTPMQRKGTSAVYALATVLAWVALLRRRARFRQPLVAPLLAVMTFVGLLFLAIPRYRAPYDPYLFLVAASLFAAADSARGSAARRDAAAKSTSA